ncbi:hypothetical protein [Herbaspirillum rubrisubalbicans]|uniref:Uncharacterized protein n=1 Tax=Herbaspirillum rubrisubalbicans TaxID=80842 RepID=A0AAD0XH73_9BURK|nr:hypothetical protein [Herbaspirillum rubrisubalbicans]AYR24233.1 hypothetical protein RC54_10515 [Herbaspirillum rubrisubalbicans]
MSGHLRSRAKRAARKHKHHVVRDHGSLTMAQMPWRMRATFGPVEDILTALETTGDIDVDNDGAVYRAPSSHAWYDLAGAIEGFAEFYEAHARISGREMPTRSLRQLANKFAYGVMIFQSDVDAVRRDLAILKQETLPMTEHYTTTIIQSMTEEA